MKMAMKKGAPLPAPFSSDTKLDWEATPPIAAAKSAERPSTFCKDGDDVLPGLFIF